MSFFTKITNADNHPEGTLLQEITDLIVRGGVWNILTDMLVSEKAAGADMSVDVSVGNIYLKRDSFCRPCWTDAITNVAINNNVEANPRITTIIAYVDLVNPAGAAGQGADVGYLFAVDGVAAASPVAPNASAIEAVIGTSDPYEIIADVYVIPSETAIEDADITDRRRKAVAKLPSSIETVDFTTPLTPDMHDGNQQEVILTAALTLVAPDNMQIGEWFTMTFVQDGTGGFDVTWFSGITWMSADYSLNTSPNQRNSFAFKKLTNTTYEGYLVGKQY